MSIEGIEHNGRTGSDETVRFKPGSEIVLDPVILVRDEQGGTRIGVNSHREIARVIDRDNIDIVSFDNGGNVIENSQRLTGTEITDANLGYQTAKNAYGVLRYVRDN
ncbi:MAG: hypothetical protein M1426_04765 [Patescibacteria group bacterium]|nr:hypothetical protein [Patescibacteria group bacterium]